MFLTQQGGEVVFYAIDPRDRGYSLHHGVSRMCLGWEDYSIETKHEPLKTYPDQDLVLDNTEGEHIVFLEVEIPEGVQVERRGFALLLHANINPKWIKGVFEYTRIQHGE